MSSSTGADDDVDELVRAFASRLALEDEGLDVASTSKSLTESQRTVESCGWMPRARAFDLERWTVMDANAFARGIGGLARARARTRSRSTLRAWWVGALEILRARRTVGGGVAVVGLDAMCAMLMSDAADLAMGMSAPDRERWGEMVEELAAVSPEVATREQTLALVARELYACAPESLLGSAISALKSRMTQSTREEMYWLSFALCAVEHEGADAEKNALRFLTEFDPSKWAAAYRKSDFRHSLSMMLFVVLSRYLSRGRPKVGSLDVAAVNRVLNGVVKWMNENEKKHNNVALPLRAIITGLEFSQETKSADGMPKWRLFLDARTRLAFEQKIRISSACNAIRGVLLGASSERTDVSEIARQSLYMCIDAIRKGYDLDDSTRPLALAQSVMELQRLSPAEGARVLDALRDEKDDSIVAAVCIISARMVSRMTIDGVRSDAKLSAFVDDAVPKILEDTLISSSNPTITAVLVCLRFTDPRKISAKMVEQACGLLNSKSIAVRNAVESFLLHLTRSKIDARDETLQALASSVLNLRDIVPAARLSAINALSNVCKTWCECAQIEGVENVSFNPERAEAASLLLACDADFSVRQTAIQSLKEIATLVGLIHGHNLRNQSVYNVVQRYMDSPEVSTFIREISGHVAQECVASYTTAHAQIYQRIQAMMVAEGDGKMLVVPVNPSEYKYNLWQNYMLFVCSGDVNDTKDAEARQVVTVGHRGSLQSLLQTVIPRLGQSSSEVDAIMRLFQIVPDHSKSIILKALLPLQSTLMRSTLVKRKRREDLSMVIGFGQVYQRYAVDGVFKLSDDSKKSVTAAIDFVLMVCSYLKTTAKSECSTTEIYQLKFSAAAIIGAVLIDEGTVESLPIVTQKSLWDDLLEWQEMSNPSMKSSDVNNVTSLEYVHRLIRDLAHNYTRNPTDQDVSFAAREALASFTLSAKFTQECSAKIVAWTNKLIESGDGPSLELPRRVILNVLRSNPSTFETSLNLCYSPSEKISRMYVLALSTLSELALRALPSAQLIALILCKIVDPVDEIRSAIEILLHQIKAEYGLVGKQTNTARIDDKEQLVQDFERLVETDTQAVDEILLEVWKRQFEETRVAARVLKPQVVSCLLPWISALHLPHLLANEKTDKLLMSLFQVTMNQNLHQSAEVEKLWVAIGSQPRNVAPAFKFLQEKIPTIAIKSQQSEGVFETAKAVCGWLARALPQQAVDQLVYTISFRALESDDGESSKAASKEFAIPQPSKISPADVGIILLSELATSHHEDFRFHLPVLAHTVVVTLIVTQEPIVRQHCGDLLCNLATNSSSAGGHAMNPKSPAYRMIRLFADDAAQPWKLTKIKSLISLIPVAIDMDENLPQRWASEARRWLLRSPSFSLACASAMTLVSLNVPLDDESFTALLAATCASAALSEGADSSDKRRKMATSLTQHLLKTLAASLCDMKSHEVLMFTQVFWCGVMCLRSQDVELYSCAIDLVCVFLYKCPLDDSPMTFEVISACSPLPRGSYYPEIPLVESYDELLSYVPEKMPRPEISWDQLISLVIKGLFESSTFLRSVRVLATLIPHLPHSERWNELELSVLTSHVLVPLVLAAAQSGSSSLIGDVEARTIAHRLAQGLHGIEPDLTSALSDFASRKQGDESRIAALESAFTLLLSRSQSLNAEQSPVHLLREFSLCSDSATAKKILQLLSKAPKSSKSFKRDFSTSWSTHGTASTIADAAYGVLLSARLETDSKGAAPSCLDY